MAWRDCARELDRLLKASKVRSVDIHRALGFDEGQISRWRSGQQVPDAEQLEAILAMCDVCLADYLKRSTSWVAGGKPSLAEEREQLHRIREALTGSRYAEQQTAAAVAATRPERKR